MKGKIILIDISQPVEGMQVVWNDKVYQLNGKEGEDNDGYQEDYWLVGTKHQNDSYEPLDVFKQLAIEYEEVTGTVGQWQDNDVQPYKIVGVKKKKTLPLHPDQWNTGIALIGHECEFETYNSYKMGDGKCLCNTVEEAKKCEHFTGPPINDCLLHDGEVTTYAKLSLPTPVRTINDIPEELRKNYPSDWSAETEHLLSTKENRKRLLQSIMELDEKDGLYDQESWHDISVRFMKSIGYSKHLDGFMTFLEQNYLPPKKKE